MTARIRVDLAERGYDIVVGVDAAAELGTLLAGRARVAVVTQQLIADVHGDRVRGPLTDAGIAHELFTIDDGEDAKSLATIERLTRQLARWGVKRPDALVAFGGGVVGDTAGFTAAIYYRGVDVVQVPTTLLAMVDASIGGKTAIDIGAGKNLVGAFHHPDAVFADVSVLATLPRRQRASGLAEIVKTACLVDDASVAQVDRAIPGVVRGESGATLASVTLAAEVKASVVTADPQEQGVRVLLNFGHTMGHALEAGGGYRLLHGEAVALGMVYATALSEILGLAEDDLRFDLERILTSASLPTRARIPARAWTLLGRDKKARGGKVRWILPRRVGKFAFVTDVPDRALRQAARVLEAR